MEVDVNNPFRSSRTIARSPMRARSMSLVDYDNVNQQKMVSTNKRDLINPSVKEIESLKAELANAIKKIGELESELIHLRKNIKNDSNGNELKPKEQENCPEERMEYHTDEEFKDNPEEYTEQQPRKRSRKHTPPITKNKTQARTAQPSIQHDPAVLENSRTPPIILKDIKNYNDLGEKLRNLGTEFTATGLSNNGVKLNIKNPDHFRRVVKYLDQEKYSWFTYECKQTRDIKVMAKRIPASADPDYIKDDLKSQGFAIKVVTNIIRKRRITNEKNQLELTREPLPMFMLSFNSDQDINKIMKIENIVGAKVKIEPLRKSRLVPQCRNCQAFGHTQNFCRLTPRCVKCAGNHETKNCKKPEKSKPKCANCQQNHVASYRGCEVAREAQKRRKKETASKENIPPRRNLESVRKAGISYAQVSEKNAVGEKSRLSSEDSFEKIFKMMEQQNKTLNDLSNRVINMERYNHGVAGPSRYH